MIIAFTSNINYTDIKDVKLFDDFYEGSKYFVSKTTRWEFITRNNERVKNINLGRNNGSTWFVKDIENNERVWLIDFDAWYNDAWYNIEDDSTHHTLFLNCIYTAESIGKCIERNKNIDKILSYD